MAEILYHLGCINPCKSWDKLPFHNWWSPDFFTINRNTSNKTPWQRYLQDGDVALEPSGAPQYLSRCDPCPLEPTVRNQPATETDSMKSLVVLMTGCWHPLVYEIMYPHNWVVFSNPKNTLHNQGSLLFHCSLQEVKKIAKPSCSTIGSLRRLLLRLPAWLVRKLVGAVRDSFPLAEWNLETMVATSRWLELRFL